MNNVCSDPSHPMDCDGSDLEDPAHALGRLRATQTPANPLLDELDAEPRQRHTYQSVWTYGPSSSTPRHEAGCSCGWRASTAGTNLNPHQLHYLHLDAIQTT